MRANATQLALTPRRAALIAALLAAAAGWTATQTLDWVIPAAHGQQAGRQAGGGSSGPSQGTLGGGHTGATNQGGAGGISNPDPGSGAGNFGGNAGEGSSTTNTRPGYLGGRAGSDDGGGGGGGTVTPYSAPPVTLESLAASCPYAEPMGVGPEGRIAGENVMRLGAAGAYLNPRADAATLQSSASMLAGYQDALSGAKPDPVLAGTYLGLVAKEPVTADAVQRVSASLCVPVGIDQATAIANIAEGQRQKLERDLQAKAAAPKP